MGSAVYSVEISRWKYGPHCCEPLSPQKWPTLLWSSRIGTVNLRTQDPHFLAISKLKTPECDLLVGEQPRGCTSQLDNRPTASDLDRILNPTCCGYHSRSTASGCVLEKGRDLHECYNSTCSPRGVHRSPQSCHRPVEGEPCSPQPPSAIPSHLQSASLSPVVQRDLREGPASR